MKRHVAKEEGWPKFITIKLTGYSVTRKNTESYGLTGSKMFKRHFLDNTLFVIPHFAQVYLRNQFSCIPKCSKVCCKKEEERIQIIYKTQNQHLPPSGPFSQILSHLL